MAYAGTPYSENQPMRQVPIMQTLGMLDTNLTRTFPEVASEVGAIRSTRDLQAAADAVIRIAGEEGRQLGSVQGSERVMVDQPGIAQALDAMGIKSPAAQESIAIALANLIPGKTYGGDDIVYGSLPRGGTPSGGARSMRADTPLVKAMEESGMDLDPDTMSRTMGAALDSGIPKTSTTRPMPELCRYPESDSGVGNGQEIIVYYGNDGPSEDGTVNLTYNRSDIVQGNRLRQEAEERPTTFAEYDGAVDPITPDNMDTSNQRMAGPIGARALQLMNDPVALQATNTWMELFGESNEGAAFNQTKSEQAMNRQMATAEADSQATLKQDEQRGIE